jgi:hypothetical protein
MGMVQAGINLVRPDWIRFRSTARLAAGAITLGVVYSLPSHVIYEERI